MDFHVARALEFFVDHIVHARAGVDQCRGNDCQAAAFLDVACCAEEPLWPLQGVGVHAAGEHFSGGRHHGVVGPRQPRNRIEQDHDVFLVLDQALGFFQHHFSDLHMAGGRLIEG